MYTPGAPAGYEIVRELGRGGMGIVYEARQISLDRRVALKVMIAGREGSPDLLRRFVQEARAAARLDHPHIAHVYEVGVEGNVHYFTMEMVEGAPLSRLAQAGMAPERAAAIARQVALALEYAHAQGVIHRDMKPANIIVDAAGEPHLLDFGLAKDLHVDGLTAYGVGIGTPAYASPEQIGGEIDRVGPASDVYSLGATLYEMLAGRPPFAGESGVALLVCVLERQPKPPRKWAPDLPRDLETICLKALEKEPNLRYPTAAAMAEDLGRYLAGEPIEATPVSRATRLAAGFRRRPGALAAVAALAVVLVAAGGALGWHRWDAHRRVTQGVAQAASAEARAASATDRKAQIAAWAESRDALRGVLQAEPDRASSREALTRAEARIAALQAEEREERARAARDATAAEEVLRKSNLVSGVLARWSKLEAALLEIERVGHALHVSDEEVKATVDRLWPQFQAFSEQTPKDDTSQATMQALLGWAYYVGGDDEHARALAHEATERDADVPYGPFVEAMLLSDDYVATLAESAPMIMSKSTAPPSAQVVEMRQKVRGFLDRGEKARVWGREGVEDFRAAFQGLDLTMGGEPAEADKALTRAIEAPDLHLFRMRFLLMRSLVRIAGSDLEGASHDLAEVRHAWPGDETAEAFHEAIGLLQLQRLGKGGGIRPEDVQGLGELVDMARDAPELQGNPELRGHLAVFQAAMAAQEGKDTRETYRQAIRDLTTAIEAYPTNTNARMSRGTAWMGIGRIEDKVGAPSAESYRQALVDFDAVVVAQPKTLPPRIARAATREAAGDAKGALEDWTEATRIEPKHLQAWQRSAALAEELGDLVRWRDALDGLLKIDPKSMETRRARATVRARLGETAGAIEDLDAWIQAKPDDAAAIAERGAVRMQTNDAKGAFADFNAALARDARCAEAWMGRGRARQALGDLDKAREDLRRALRCAPADWPQRKAVEDTLADLERGR